MTAEPVSRILPTLRASRFTDEISDGAHTFGQLYEQRALLLALVIASNPQRESWRTWTHHPDDEACPHGFFLVGLDTPAGLVTFHVRAELWALFGSCRETLSYAPRHDGHTAADSSARLSSWLADRWAVGS